MPQTCTFGKMKKVLVLGENGQLASALRRIAPERNWSFIGRDKLNLAETGTILGKLDREDFDILINTAAYTAVDRAEDEQEMAFKINAEALAPMAEACRARKAVLVHLSTDYVFGNVPPTPIAEDTRTEPTGVYGTTKLRGEETIRSLHPEHYIIRTSWLYGIDGHNFMKTMLDLSQKRDRLDVVFDQVGSPTFAGDLALILKHITNLESAKQQKVYGTYHYSNEGVASWYDFAHAIFDMTGISVRLSPVDSSRFVTRAKRPSYSVLDKTKIKDTFGIEIPHWRDSLRQCLAAMNKLK